MTDRTGSDVDARVAARMKRRRREIGMPQERLGPLVGVTYQQVQKYETGANRITAGRLHAVAVALGVPVGWFFEEGE